MAKANKTRLLFDKRQRFGTGPFCAAPRILLNTPLVRSDWHTRWRTVRFARPANARYTLL